jgi:flavin-dependent dehydrogenase
MNENSICILGAGPSGIITALKLKQLGYNPLVLDYKKRDGNIMVQSLSPGIITLLGTLGIGIDEFQGICVPIERSLKLWNGEMVETVDPPGFLTDRGQFDSSLRGIAIRQGINLLQDAKVISLEQSKDGWKICLLHERKYQTLTADFLVDASGKKSLIRGTKKRVAAATLAITGIWVNGGIEKNETRLESGINNWLWGASLSDGGFHATLFMDPEFSHISGGDGLVNMYRYYLGRTALFKSCLNGKLRGNLIANDVTPFNYEKPSAPNYIKVGESSLGLDPVSSQGIQSSMAAAIQAAVVVNTILADPKNASLAIEFYQERQKEQIRLHVEKISAAYANAGSYKDNLFWTKRIMKYHRSESMPAPESWTPSQRVEFSPETALLPTGCIVGNQVSSRAGLVHPLLKRPIVFWENKEIVSILGTLQGRFELSEWIRRWSEKINQVAAVRLFDQLKNMGVLVAARD